MSQDLMTIDLRVLKNPCVNKGICQGPETDPECTSTNRTKGADMVMVQLQLFVYLVILSFTMTLAVFGRKLLLNYELAMKLPNVYTQIMQVT